MKSVKVLIADPLPLAVERLEKLLSEDSRIEIVATATSGEEVLEKATATKPNVILMDLRFDDMQGHRLIRELSVRQLEVAVLILSTDARKGHPMLSSCLKAGAFDFIQRPGSLKDLERITRQITTRVQVASFSKTKQIPTGDLPPVEEGAEELILEPMEETAAPAPVPAAPPAPVQPAAPEPPAPAPAPDRHAEGIETRPLDLDAVLIDCPAERLRELLVLLTSIEATLKPALLVVIRRPAPFAETFVAKIKEKLKVPVNPLRDGDQVSAGCVLVIESLDHDLIMEKSTIDDTVDFTQSTARRGGNVPLPGIDKLLEGLAKCYGGRAGAILLGGDPTTTVEGLRALRAQGGVAVIEQGAAVLAQAVPEDLLDGVLAADQLAALINRIGA